MSVQDRMAAGDWYSCLGDGPEALRQHARRAVHAHNTTAPDARGGIAPELAALFARIGGRAIVMPGARVGAGAIVGAESVVTRDVASGATVIGIPARAIGSEEKS